MKPRERILPVPQGNLRTVRALLPRRENEDERARRERLEIVRRAASLMPYLSVKLQGGTFVTTPADAGNLIVKGSRAEFVVLRRAVELAAEAGKPAAGKALLDVGANVGTTTVTALRTHGFGRSVAVEPDPANVRLLRANVALNDVGDRVEVVPAAATDRAGTVRFARGRRADGGWSTGTGRVAADGVAVDAVTLDEVASRCGVDPTDVGLLWLDVQGHEAAALAGARRLLAARPPLVVAMRPLELAGADDLRLLQELLGDYTRFVDLRRPTLRSRWRPVPKPIAALAELEGESVSTDLLLLA